MVEVHSLKHEIVLKERMQSDGVQVQSFHVICEGILVTIEDISAIFLLHLVEFCLHSRHYFSLLLQCLHLLLECLKHLLQVLAQHLRATDHYQLIVLFQLNVQHPSSLHGRVTCLLST